MSDKGNIKGAVDYVFSTPATPVTLTSIKEGTATRTRTFRKTDRAAAAKWIAGEQAEQRNIYFQDCSVRGVNKRPTKADVSAIHAAHVDIDAQGVQAQLAAEKATILAKLHAYDPPPIDIIDTGNGLQAYWYLTEALPGTRDNIARIEAINRKLADDLGGDRCHDVAHLLRVPALVNFPNKTKIAKGRVVCESALMVCGHDGFENYTLDDLPQGSNDTATTSNPADDIPDDIPDTVDLFPLDTAFRSLIVEGVPPDATYKIGDGSKSGLTYYVAARLREDYGFTDGEIISVITTPLYAAADHILDQTQRKPEVQAMRVIADLNKRGVKRGSRDNAEGLKMFADDPWQPGESDRKRQEDMSAKTERAREAEQRVRNEYKEQRYTLPEICDEWVWIAPLKRFVNRKDPEYALDKEAFNDRFQYLKGEVQSLTKLLMGRTEDTIRKLRGVVYRPNADEFTEDGLWNGWRPSPVVAAPGDTSLFDAHMQFIFPNEADRVAYLNWHAAVLQHPETKPRHQLMVTGKTQGTGKTFMPRLMQKLLGSANCQALTQDILESGFTGWAMRTKFVWIEEIRNVMNSKSATNKLHSWASESTITVNQKNLPTFVMDQAIAFELMSNKEDAIAPDNTDRRYLILNTDAKVHSRGGEYYDALYGVNNVGGVLNTPKAQGAILHKLVKRDLSGYRIEGPAPFTAAKQTMIDASGTEWSRWLLDHPPTGRVVDPDELVKEMPRYLQARGAGKAVRDTLRERFNGAPWPDQIRPDGRQGGKVRVWLIGPIADQASLLTSADVLAMYREDRQAERAPFAATADDDFGA